MNPIFSLLLFVPLNVVPEFGSHKNMGFHSFMHACLHLFSGYLLNSYYVSGPELLLCIGPLVLKNQQN